MPFSDLRTFLRHLEARGDLRRSRIEVDPTYEIAEIAQRCVREEGPALLFERVEGSRFPLAINFLGTLRRIEHALGMHPEELGRRLVDLAEQMMPPSPSGVWARRDLFRRLAAFRPRRALRAPVHEIVGGDLDLDALPIIKCWPEDAGPFITFPLVITRHPATGRSNLGIYRMQVFDARTTGMHWQIHKGGGFHYHEAEKRGEALPVAVVLGADPALMLAGIFPLPEGMEEIAFAGILRARATRLVRARTVPIDVPAGAEMVLEGEVPPGERRREGPFGDHFGHYCDPADFPVFRLRTVTRRRSAIYPAAVVGKPPQEDRAMGDASQMILGPLIRLIRPEVRDVWAYYQAGFHNLLAVALEARYTREPIRTAMGILGEGQLGLSKVVVLVDRDVDARAFVQLLRAIRAHFDPREHFLLIPRAPLDTLDFTSFEMHRGSRMVIDATGSRAQYSGGAPVRGAAVAGAPAPGKVLGADPREVAPHVARWRLWEETLLAVQLDRVEAGLGRKTIETLVAAPALAGVKIVAAVSPDVRLDDDVDLIWGIFTRFDPARDIAFTETSLTGIQPNYAGVMGIDATWKPGYPNAVAMPEDVVKKVDARWAEYWK
ncbi:MAG: UbiD family decarboxylase [Candidatus Krumholzibacteria bacterium]|nr:UbiD family decarboxylase [Candidatus Krumholzibacteria bacterium]